MYQLARNLSVLAFFSLSYLDMDQLFQLTFQAISVPLHLYFPLKDVLGQQQESKGTIGGQQ